MCESRFGPLAQWIGVATLRSIKGDAVVGDEWREESVVGTFSEMVINGWMLTFILGSYRDQMSFPPSLPGRAETI